MTFILQDNLVAGKFADFDVRFWTNIVGANTLPITR